MGRDIIQVRDELLVLLYKQIDAWERAMAIGLTEEEIRDYEERETLLRTLLHEMDAIAPAA